MPSNNYDDLGILVEEFGDMVDYYRSDPVAAAYDLLNVDLPPIQRIVLRDMWFKDYTIMVMGRGVGKSVSVDSLCHIKDKGLVHLDEVLPQVPTYLRDGEEEDILFNESIYTDSGFKDTKRLCLEKNIDGLCLITKRGFIQKASKHHKILTEDLYGNTIYKSLEDITDRDIVCIQINQQVFGDGDVSDTNLNNICNLIVSYDITTIPKIIRYANKAIQIKFIDKLFEQGYFVCIYEDVIYELQIMLLNIGILSNLSRVYKNGFVEYTLDIDGCYDGDDVVYFCDFVDNVVPWVGDCYDFMMDMDGEPNYFANGFINHNTYLLGVNAALHAMLFPGHRIGLISSSFRQSKLIFAEVERLYDRSPIFREACEKKPTRGADSCFFNLKSTNTSNGSYIEALPIGVDGAKIRGSRFYLIEIDELAQMPPQIIDMVISPMSATVMDPMKKVREIERIKILIEKGLATEDDLNISSANKMVMSSSGYYKFNHMWDRMRNYWQAIKDGNDKYCVHQVPYYMMPQGFLDMENIKKAERTMPRIEFMMEYEGLMVADSEGFFKASLIESCTRNSTFSIMLSGEKGKEYVMGVDPNQGGTATNALCGIIIEEKGSPNKVVYVDGITKNKTQDIVSQIQNLCELFNIVRICMDSQGGGKAVKDLLYEGYNGKPPILDIEDESTYNKFGRRVLLMVNPTPQWIADANYDALAMMERKELLFPNIPLTKDEKGESTEEAYEYFKLLRSQLLNIIVTESGRGVRHFDTPKKGQNKDLYSAFILASWGVREMDRGFEDDTNVCSTGLIREHVPGARFMTSKMSNNNRFGAAVLTKRFKK